MKLVNWNLEWATVPWRTEEILNRVNRHSPEVACQRPGSRGENC